MHFDEEWVKAEPIVQALLYQKSVTPAAWQDLFYHVYKITSWITDGSERIRNILTNQIDRYVYEANSRIRSLQTDEGLLNCYIKEWNRFYKQASILPLPFKKIDDFSHPKRRSVVELQEETIRSLMLEKWNETIFINISEPLLIEALRLVKEERDGNIIDSNNIIGIRESFVALNEKLGEEPLRVYINTFEKQFIAQTTEYYEKICRGLLAELGVIEYMVYADKKLEEEQKRAYKYLEMSSPTAKKHMEKAVIALVENFEDTILAECSKLIAQRDVEREFMINVTNPQRLASTYLVVIVKLCVMSRRSSSSSVHKSRLHEMKLIIASRNLSPIDETVSFGYPMRIIQSAALFQMDMKVVGVNVDRFTNADENRQQYTY
uniref:Cullin-5 n=1 Tax=Caenorhabditis japonica TaxID=281687 RepID=A0A8R1J2C7_CAEJA